MVILQAQEGQEYGMNGVPFIGGVNKININFFNVCVNSALDKMHLNKIILFNTMPDLPFHIA